MLNFRFKVINSKAYNATIVKEVTLYEPYHYYARSEKNTNP
jgi:hypothetical protein